MFYISSSDPSADLGVSFAFCLADSFLVGVRILFHIVTVLKESWLLFY